jgi:hypothetical protein
MNKKLAILKKFYLSKILKKIILLLSKNNPTFSKSKNNKMHNIHHRFHKEPEYNLYGGINHLK